MSWVHHVSVKLNFFPEGFNEGKLIQETKKQLLITWTLIQHRGAQIYEPKGCNPLILLQEDPAF